MGGQSASSAICACRRSSHPIELASALLRIKQIPGPLSQSRLSPGYHGGQNWQLVDSFGNIFNRLILVCGDVPHSEADGWGTRLEEGRLYQTFFFRTVPEERTPVTINHSEWLPSQQNRAGAFGGRGLVVGEPVID